MARFVQCPKCFELNEKGSATCSSCRNIISNDVGDAAAVHMFPTGLWEHLDANPIYIKGREHLKSVCSDLGVRANILD